MTKTLPLTVLAYEGPQARAYLARMRQAGWQPERILLMVQSRHPTSGKPVGRWLPRPLRLKFAAKAQDITLNHWPRRLRASYPHLFAAVVEELSRTFDGAAGLIEEMLGAFRYQDYAPRVDPVLTADLRDPALADALSGHGPGAVLFTGGGILRKNLLDLPGLRFLHVHPGYLPHVRGADGLLWSLLVRGRPGASCFYMESGIDTGEVIAGSDFPRMTFTLSGGRPRPDDTSLYRAIFSYYDPLLRAELLATRVLGEGLDLCALPTAAQDPGSDEGITYHFMHPRLRHKALEALFVNG